MFFKKTTSDIFIVGVISVLVGCHAAYKNAEQRGSLISEGEPIADAVGDVINLEQGWTEDTQQAFYFTNQGSRIMPYDWFLVLEQANSQEKFISVKNIESLRYLPSKPNDWNPDGLPVGFAKNTSGSGQEWVGLTCAACHTTQISYQGVNMRIDGGPTLGDFERLNHTMVDAMSATYQSAEKFARFAKAVLGDGLDTHARENLRQSLLKQTEALAYRNQVNRSGGADQPHYGFGRLDAIGAIFNKVMVELAGVPENIRPSDAPASYPFLWGTSQSDVVQWTGFAPNGPKTIGALVRNGGEVVGVYGAVDIPKNKHALSYKSSLQILNLGKLEAWVTALRSPAWPAEYLPPVDPIVASKGKFHYDKYCASCHEVIPRNDEGKPYKAVLTKISALGTDPGEWNNMSRLLNAGKFEGRKEAVIAGSKIPAEVSGLDPLVNTVTGSLLRHPGETVKAILTQIDGGKEAKEFDAELHTNKNEMHPQLSDSVSNYIEKYKVHNEAILTTDTPSVQKGVYKARPLNGIWATAPYLHNGSVPNLYELLLPVEKRSESFYLGSRELDAKKVGFVSTPEVNGTAAFKFDTRLKGNSNAGHTYGSELEDEQRWELVEYMKTL